GDRPAAADRQGRHQGALPAGAGARLAGGGAHGRARMSSLAAGALQAGGVALAPLLPGTIQSLKARLQGRRGASPLQPYRMLRRLWGKSAVDPQGTGPVYRLAPPLAVACLLAAFALVPVGGRSGDWPLGNDALALVGL